MELYNEEENEMEGDNNYMAVEAMTLFATNYLPLLPLWGGILFPFCGEKISRQWKTGFPL